MRAHFRVHWPMHLLSMSALLYLLQVCLQYSVGDLSLWIFLGIYACLFALWFPLVFGNFFGYVFAQDCDPASSARPWLLDKRFVVVWAIVLRLIGCFGDPILEDDWYRYLWDGYRFISTGSPYGVAPLAFFGSVDLPHGLGEILSGINNPDLPTIYAPVLQWVFAAAYLLGPGQVGALQLLLVVFDLALIFLLFNWASPRWVLVYAACPLVIKEIAFTAHPDVVAIMLCVLALQLRQRGLTMVAACIAALAVAAKILAVFILPWVLWRMSWRCWVVCAVVLVSCYAPFIWQGGSDHFSLLVFAKLWQFNASFYALLQPLLGADVAKVSLAVVFLGILAWYFFVKNTGAVQPLPRFDLIYAGFLLIAPVLNPWYWLWVLPFAVVYPTRLAWCAAAALLLSYINGLWFGASELDVYQLPVSVQLLEYTIILAAAMWDWWGTPLQKLQKTTYRNN